MPPVLDYGRPDAVRLEVRSLLIGGGVQLVTLLLAASCMDEGGLVLSATARLSAAYWTGVVLVLVRRHDALTAGDHRYFRVGLLGILLVGGPSTLAIWSHWGIG